MRFIKHLIKLKFQDINVINFIKLRNRNLFKNFKVQFDNRKYF